MMYKDNVNALLEQGRSIIDYNKVDEHYQQVSKLVLQEVPFIHLGYIYGMSIYRNDKVLNTMKIKGREENRLHFYRKI